VLNETRQSEDDDDDDHRGGFRRHEVFEAGRPPHAAENCAETEVHGTGAELNIARYSKDSAATTCRRAGVDCRGSTSCKWWREVGARRPSSAARVVLCGSNEARLEDRASPETAPRPSSEAPRVGVVQRASRCHSARSPRTRATSARACSVAAMPSQSANASDTPSTAIARAARTRLRRRR